MDLQPSAPPVVVVVVTTDPGEWFEECLASVAAQDYPNLSVLIVDTASTVDPTPRVASVLPGAYVRRLNRRCGFGTAADEVLAVVEGASHYLFCHDDVALAPDAVRLLVEEAFRSNAGITTPKLVTWSDPERLVCVGMGADRYGTSLPLVEPGELDQAQHDAVRDVFVAPSSITLVRADLFETLGGFSPGVDQFGEDLDLSWRTRLAGGRVVVVPDARVRHLQAQVTGLRPGWTTEASAQRARHQVDAHRVRTLLTCYRAWTLVRLLPGLVALTLLDALILAARGRLADAGAALTAPGRALAHPAAIWADRRRVQAHRRLRDPQIRRLQSKSSARLRSLVRAGGVRLAPLLTPAGGSEEEDSAWAPAARWVAGEQAGVSITAGQAGLGTPGDPAVSPAVDVATAKPVSVPEAEIGAPGSGSWRGPLVAWAVVIVVVLVGARGLLGQHLPAVGSLPQTQGGVGSWWHQWWAGWRPQGLGSDAAPPPALWMLALAGGVLGGAVGTLQHILVLGPLLVGPWGAWRTARWFGSRPGRVAALVVYAMVAVPVDALARGRWSGLLVYAAAPWIVTGLARASGAKPFGELDRRDRILAALRTGLLVGLVAAFVPGLLLLVVPVLAVGLAGGLAVTGAAGRARPVFAVALGATAIGFVLLLPWSAPLVTSADALFGVGSGDAGRLGLGQLLHFATGPVGDSVLGWAFLAAAALPLVIGRSWRLAWAGRLWTLAIWCWIVEWMASRGWLGVSFGDPDVLLAFAAAALALAACLGVVAFQVDLPGYRFGWRQAAAGLAAVAVVCGSLPTLAGAVDGRWHLPGADASSTLLLPDRAEVGDYRVLWVGDPAGLPLGSWRLESGVGYGTSIDGEPDILDAWAPVQSGATPLIATDLRLARDQETTQLGHLLAPMAIRYIVVPNHNAPSGSGAAALAVPADVLRGLGMQTDLRLESPDPDYTVYLNAAWAPGTALVPARAGAVASQRGPAARAARQRALERTSLAGAHPTLVGGITGSARGAVPAGGSVFVSASRSGRWHLDVAGHQRGPAPAFGWAMQFATGGGGQASLAAPAPLTSDVARGIEMGLWVAAVAGAVVLTRRRRRARDRATAPQLPVAAPATDARRPVPAGAAGLDADELWTDG